VAYEIKDVELAEEGRRRVEWAERETMGIHIDTLTPEQQEYLASWHQGT